METTLSPPVRSLARVATDKAERYLGQMCKHFAHKLPVIQKGANGTLPFSIGTCRMEADGGGLTLRLEAPDADQMAQLQEVVASHLLRFAFREDMTVEWTTPA